MKNAILGKTPTFQIPFQGKEWTACFSTEEQSKRYGLEKLSKGMEATPNDHFPRGGCLLHTNH